MPGSRNCARCGGLLALAAAAINVHPPRAGRISRSMPRVWGRVWNMRRAFENYRNQAARPFTDVFARFADTDFSLGTILRCIIPGWAHRHRGNVYRGCMFFYAYVALIIPAILFFGTPMAGILLGLAFATHVASASDALVGRYASVGDRLMFTFVCSAAIGLSLYFPIGAAMSRVAVPIRLNQPIQGFAAGDVLWYQPSPNIHADDYALYRIADTTLPGYNNHTRYVLQNQWIGRVVATAGQRVQRKDGKLYVDNLVSTAPIPTEFVSELDGGFVVPEGSVYIPPATMLPAGARLRPDDWRRLSIVPHDRILGRVFFRSQPLWRMSGITGVMNGIE
jgi:Signal peptidase, peptidase S26